MKLFDLRDALDISDRAQDAPLLFHGRSRSTIMGDHRTRIAGGGSDDFHSFHEFDPDYDDVTMIDWPATMAHPNAGQPDAPLIVRRYNEMREVPVRILLGANRLLFQSRWESLASRAAYVVASLMVSASELHDPVSLFPFGDDSAYEDLAIPPAPTRSVIDQAMEAVFEAVERSVNTGKVSGHDGLEDVIQSLPTSPSLVFIVMALPPPPDPRDQKALEARRNTWQVVAAAQEAGHDVRCILVVDPIQEALPELRFPAVHHFLGAGAVLNCGPTRRRWAARFQAALQVQKELMDKAGVAWCIARTSDDEGQSYDFLAEVGEAI